MEHRWGRRVAMRVPVRLIADSGEPAHGHIADLSISGAFIRVDRSVPLWSRLQVEIAPAGELERKPERERLAAHIIRRTPHGVAIEWHELAPRVVRDLLRAHDPSRASGSRDARARGARQELEPQAARLAPLAARAGTTAMID